MKRFFDDIGDMRKIVLLFVSMFLILPTTLFAAQHDYNIANNPGAAVRADINSAYSAVATNNSGATEPATIFANQWWMDTSTNLLKQRDNANTAWVNVALKSGTGWIPYREGSQTGTGSLLTTDTDTSLTADSDDRVATQKAGKAYSDANVATKISKSIAGEIAVITEKTALVDDDLFLIEDSEDSNNKKRVKKSNLITSNTGVEEFLVDGTFEVPAGITRVWVTLVGGGGGAGAADTARGSGGAGAGETKERVPYDVTPLASIPVQIGDGGIGGINNGTDGQDSTFDTTGVVALGGLLTTDAQLAGGLGGNSGAIRDGGDAGQPTGGIAGAGVWFPGGDGGDAQNASNSGGGGGGGTPYGAGGAGGLDGGAGSLEDGEDAAANSGGGGGGSSSSNSAEGGDGGSGYGKIEW